MPFFTSLSYFYSALSDRNIIRVPNPPNGIRRFSDFFPLWIRKKSLFLPVKINSELRPESERSRVSFEARDAETGGPLESPADDIEVDIGRPSNCVIEIYPPVRPPVDESRCLARPIGIWNIDISGVVDFFQSIRNNSFGKRCRRIHGLHRGPRRILSCNWPIHKRI